MTLASGTFFFLKESVLYGHLLPVPPACPSPPPPIAVFAARGQPPRTAHENTRVSLELMNRKKRVIGRLLSPLHKNN